MTGKEAYLNFVKYKRFNREIFTKAYEYYLDNKQEAIIDPADIISTIFLSAYKKNKLQVRRLCKLYGFSNEEICKIIDKYLCKATDVEAVIAYLTKDCIKETYLEYLYNLCSNFKSNEQLINLATSLKIDVSMLKSILKYYGRIYLDKTSFKEILPRLGQTSRKILSKKETVIPENYWNFGLIVLKNISMEYFHEFVVENDINISTFSKFYKKAFFDRYYKEKKVNIERFFLIVLNHKILDYRNYRRRINYQSEVEQKLT